MEWISVHRIGLPEPNKYVLGWYNGGNWKDLDDPVYVHCVVVKLIRGISLEKRKTLAAQGNPRACLYTSGDQYGNNKYPYAWDSFGPISYFSQDITYWAFLPTMGPEEVKNDDQR